MSDSLLPHELQHARPPCASPTPGVHSNSRPSSRWCHQPSHPLSSPSPPAPNPSPPAPNPSQHQGLFQWVNSSHEVAKVLEFQLKHHSFQRNPRADLIANLDFLNLSIPNVNNILIKPPNNFLSSNFLYLIIWICIPFSWGFYLSSRNIKMLSE